MNQAHMRRPQSDGAADMAVIARAKELLEVIVDATDRAPKKFRFTFSSRLQNLALDITECVFRANEVYVRHATDIVRYEERRSLQNRALTSVKLLSFIGALLFERNGLRASEYERILQLASACQRLLGGWIASDARRWSDGEGARHGA
ncbi:MAG: four helix bundle protein [Propionibacteriaceae bacterium]|nr:four helix bundle protein [Propionibacteriaceae bacterium]